MLERLKTKLGVFGKGEANPEDLRARLSRTRKRLKAAEEELRRARADAFPAERVVWIFGTGRSGSTWLASMMEDLPGHTIWREPLVGELFGHLYYVSATERHHSNKHFILGSHRDTWLGLIRRCVLEGAAARFPGAAGGHLIVKEPNGSIGSPLLMEALPESRMVLLVRDPRDVVASAQDAFKPGAWGAGKENVANRGDLVRSDPEAYARERAKRYLLSIGNSKAAYEAHAGPKALVRYEDLLADSLSELRRVYSELGIEVRADDLARTVQKHSWENVPLENRGEAKFYRKATPGSWREDLLPRQVEIVEEITTPLLEEFYPDR